MKTDESPDIRIAKKRRLRWSAGLNSLVQSFIETLQIMFQISHTPIFECKRRDYQNGNTEQIVVKHS